MPSWPIHLALANKLNKKLNLGDEFILGNVLPDVLGKNMINNHSQTIDKSISHFRYKNRKLIDVDSFIDKYKNYFDNPIVLGYLSHLITDKYFNDYFYINHVVGEDQKAILKNGSLYDGEEKTWQIKRRDFEIFSKKLINDNYLSNLNAKNIKKKDLIIEEVPITDSDLEKTVKKINEFSMQNKIYKPNDFEIFTEEKLMEIFNNCYKKILDTIKTLN